MQTAPTVVLLQMPPRARLCTRRRNSDLPSTVLALSAHEQAALYSQLSTPLPVCYVTLRQKTSRPLRNHQAASPRAARMTQDSRGSRTRAVRHGLQLAPPLVGGSINGHVGVQVSRCHTTRPHGRPAPRESDRY